MRKRRLPAPPVYPLVSTMSVPGTPEQVTLHESGRPPSYSECHAARSRVFVPVTLIETDAVSDCAPGPSTAVLASRENPGGGPEKGETVSKNEVLVVDGPSLTLSVIVAVPL